MPRPVAIDKRPLTSAADVASWAKKEKGWAYAKGMAANTQNYWQFVVERVGAMPPDLPIDKVLERCLAAHEIAESEEEISQSMFWEATADWVARLIARNAKFDQP